MRILLLLFSFSVVSQVLLYQISSEDGQYFQCPGVFFLKLSKRDVFIVMITFLTHESSDNRVKFKFCKIDLQLNLYLRCIHAK